MYIPEFWCGVTATLLVEFALLVAWSILLRIADTGYEDDEKDDNKKL